MSNTSEQILIHLKEHGIVPKKTTLNDLNSQFPDKVLELIVSLEDRIELLTMELSAWSENDASP